MGIPDQRAINAEIDRLSEHHADYLTDRQLAVFYCLLDRSNLAALRWLRRCVRQLPPNPINIVALLAGEKPPRPTKQPKPAKQPKAPPIKRQRSHESQMVACVCGRLKERRSKRCADCHFNARRAGQMCVDCGRHSQPRRCPDCKAADARRRALAYYYEKKRSAA